MLKVRQALPFYVSGKSYQRPGWIVVPNDRAHCSRHERFHWTVLLVALAGKAQVRRLATHQSSHAGYWGEPQTCPKLDLALAIFNSNRTTGSDTDSDAWLIDMNDGIVQKAR